MVKLVFVFMLFASTSIAQDTIKEIEIVNPLQSWPVFNGRIDEFIRENLIYPEKAINDSIEGVVYTTFYVDTLGLTFNHKIDNNEVKIPPMILQPIIENCFIYSDIESNKDGFINIYISLENNILTLITENTTSEKKESREKKISGIGLSNVEQRLNLYYGETRYILKIEELETIYKLNLTIQLK